ncbi:MAG: hypothetical protein EP344_03960 [Bacteroidetes bacterium]|nr:MAG: hypothetical protein EP344_03960 [Bacteroidota bacterium]
MAGYKISNQNALHYLTLTTVGWVDVFTRQRYRGILLDSLGKCDCWAKSSDFGRVFIGLSPE